MDLKKVSTKHILRSTLGTAKPPRRRLLPQERYARRRTSSLPDLFKPQLAAGQGAGQGVVQDSHPAHYNTIHNVSDNMLQASGGPSSVNMQLVFYFRDSTIDHERSPSLKPPKPSCGSGYLLHMFSIESTSNRGMVDSTIIAKKYPATDSHHLEIILHLFSS